MKFPLKVGDDPKPQHGSVQKDLPLKVDNVSKDWRSVSESIWLQFGGVDAFNKMQILNRCLVGQWGDFSNDALLLSSLKEWARYHWRIKGNLSLSLLGGALILFEFESSKEAERVMQEGERIYKQKFLFLDRWAPTTGCFKGVKAKSAWVRIMGLPLCLWHREFFKQVGDACGGYLGVDEKTMRGENLQWARVLVQMNGREAPGKLQVVVGDFCFTVHLWWELPPWVAMVISCKEKLEARKKKLEGSCVSAHVGFEGLLPKGELSIAKCQALQEEWLRQPFMRKGCVWSSSLLSGLRGRRETCLLLQSPFPMDWKRGLWAPLKWWVMV